ncbi:hypothetical protein J6590_107919, partial [Homalodisca vitripennis]
YGCPFVTSRLTSPFIARLSNLQAVAGHIATAEMITNERRVRMISQQQCCQLISHDQSRKT